MEQYYSDICTDITSIRRVLDSRLRNDIIRDGDSLRRYVEITDELETDASSFQKEILTSKSLFQKVLEGESKKWS